MVSVYKRKDSSDNSDNYLLDFKFALMASVMTGPCQGQPNSPKRCDQEGEMEGVKADICFLSFGWELNFSMDVCEKEGEGFMVIGGGDNVRKW